MDRNGPSVISVGESMSVNDCTPEKASISREKETNFYEEQPQERRSSRLERLRSRKPGKEELDFANRKDLGKVVFQLLEPFILGGEGDQDSNNVASCSVPCPDAQDTESDDVTRFVREACLAEVAGFDFWKFGIVLGKWTRRRASRSLITCSSCC